MLYLRRIIPAVTGFLALALFSIPFCIYLHAAGQDAFLKNRTAISVIFLIVLGTGSGAGVWIDSRLQKKLPQERYKRLVYLITAVVSLLIVLCAIMGLFLLGR